MNTITTGRWGPRISTKIGAKTGPTVVFSHGWPFEPQTPGSADALSGQNGYRVIAHDRRAWRSSQTWDGNNMGPTPMIWDRCSNN